MASGIVGLCSNLAFKKPTPRRVLRKLFPRYVEAPITLVPSWWDYIRLRPPVFTAWFHWRRMRFSRNKRHWREMRFDDPSSKTHLVDTVIPYSMSKTHIIGSLDRSERLMNILRTVEGLSPRNCKVLCVGPRNEAELLLLSLYGFPLKNITAIDLFSYSPLIKVMDMHDLQFEDSQFDIVYSSYTLSYSDDVQRACSEALRVVRDSGLMAFGFGSRPVRPMGGKQLTGGLHELYSYFDGHIKHAYWQEEVVRSDDLTDCSTIFRITKTGNGT